MVAPTPRTNGVNILVVNMAPLGDVVHSLPVVRDLHGVAEGVRVDWLVEPGVAALLRRVEGVSEVIECAQRCWDTSTCWTARARRERRRFAERLAQRRPYDATIDMQGTPLSAWIASRAGGRHFAPLRDAHGERHPWFARWQADLCVDLEPRLHQVDRARRLVARAMGYTLPGTLHYGVRVQPVPTSRPAVAFVHGGPNAAYFWPESRWVALARRFIERGWLVMLPQGSEADQVQAERMAAAIDSEITAFAPQAVSAGPVVQVWPKMGPDALADRLAGCRGVIGIDDGPSPLAVALGLPHVRIDNRATAWLSGPLRAEPVRQVAVGGDANPSLDAVWQAWCEIARTASLPGQR